MNPKSNHILAALSESMFQRLLPKLGLVSLTKNQVLYEEGGGQQGVYFPINATLALQNHGADDFINDVALVGHHSMTMAGKCCSLVSFDRTIVRLPGLAYRMGIEEFVATVREDAPTLMQLHELTQHRMKQMAKNVACASHHSAEQRIARLLLELMDLTSLHDIDLTHQEVADSIGVRRESVSIHLKELEREQAIEIHRGKICELDHHRIHHHSCGCYQGLENQHPKNTALLAVH